MMLQISPDVVTLLGICACATAMWCAACAAIIFTSRRK